MDINLNDWKRGGREVSIIHLALLIGELSGAMGHCKYMGFEKEEKEIDELVKRFYKIYFKMKKEERERLAGKKETK